MSRRNKTIPVNVMASELGEGIAIKRISLNNLHTVDAEHAKQSHREDGHSFFLLESGTISIEIDFLTYKIKAPSVIYMHPNQVHRIIAHNNVTVSSWCLLSENLNSDYLKLLNLIAPAKPLALKKESYTLLLESVTLCVKFSEQKKDKLYHSILKGSCNTLVALVLARCFEKAKPSGKLSRFETVTEAFREALEDNYTTIRQPAAYAQRLTISTAYLNECVKNATGYSVSYHIQQRVALEAKRLLLHSDKTVKEIAALLGFDDYPYFSRLFFKVTGATALDFKRKNLV